MKSLKRSLVTLAAMPMLLVVAACGGGDSEAADGGPTRVRLAVAEGSASILPMKFAESKGIFEKNGIDLDEIPMAGSALLPSFGSDAIDLALSSPQLFASGAKSDQNIKYICGMIPYDWSELLVRPDSEVPNAADAGWEATLAALQGKSWGLVSVGAVQELQVRALYNQAGIDLGSTEFIAVGVGPAANAALESGQVDVLYGAPFSSQILISTGKAKSVYRMGPDSPDPIGGALYAGYGASEKFLAEHPEAVKPFCDSIAEGLKWMQDPANSAEVKDYLRENYKIAADETLEEILKPDGILSVLSTQADCDNIDPAIEFMKANNLIDGNADLTCDGLLHEPFN